MNILIAPIYNVSTKKWLQWLRCTFYLNETIDFTQCH